MSNHDNHRRGESKRTETGPQFESHNAGEGCNSTHVARARKKWKRVGARTERRTGTTSKYLGQVRVRPEIESE